ncbi:Up-regulated during septation-domain-containing protein [Microdochium trichocladiopsis]|uniref:Up-regulated during septation-domain-containing protein n=1 Tax=Microdochium trichocladiopsis TaxID=1682393 RepID=A0A9P9BL08_9PEZI|nr:Up-regulated during septation-domain-containing protein [Microdochium trichocladiopsis]KAH7021177.1 Up-regulated during septation-domain-containing protein [Microdochium trichocladiopsis]
MSGSTRQGGPRSIDTGRPGSPGQSMQAPRGPALIDAYRRDGSSTMPSPRADGPVLLDLKDPLQVHLMTETALFDSREYQILSEEEVDHLKKMIQTTNQRIEQTRSNLAVQTKYRDAAVSMSKLYSPPRSVGGRGSPVDVRHSASSQDAEEADAERRAVQQRCEELASELFLLEKRVMDGRRRLLEHTAGILQLTHSKSKKPGTKAQLVNGVPPSPESMHTATHGRNSIELAPDDFFLFNEGSLYQSFDQLDALVEGAGGKPIEPPVRSPIREQQRQLTFESERLRSENDDLRTQMEQLIHELGAIRDESADQFQLITNTERQLEAFNNQLRTILNKTDPERGSGLGAPPSNQGKRGSMLENHLQYLDGGLSALDEASSHNSGAADKMRQISAQVQQILRGSDASHPDPPESAEGLDEQVQYLQDSLRRVQGEIERAANSSQSTSADRQKSEQSDAVLSGLWDIIQSGLADVREKKQERRRDRQDRGLEVDEDDMSDGESFDPNETYSLQAFSNKVQWLYSRAISLQDQKAVLKRQIKQQRELNSKSDSEKDEALRQKAEEVEESKSAQLVAEKELASVRMELSQTMGELDDLQKSRGEESDAIDQARTILKERNARIASLESSSKEVSTRLAQTEAELEQIGAQLDEAEEAKAAAEKALNDKEAQMKAKEAELEQMTGLYAELKLEATMARAELEAAYGSRSERAAEIAALHDTSQISKVQQRTQTLEQELKATAKDLADVVAQSLEAEKKIGTLEADLDRALAEKSRLKDELEAELSETKQQIEQRLEAEVARLQKDRQELQEALDQERFRANGPLSPGGSRGTSHLTESYRSGLRAERKKYEEQLKAEQALRRKIEDELRALKKAQGPGKSPLSPR